MSGRREIVSVQFEASFRRLLPSECAAATRPLSGANQLLGIENACANGMRTNRRLEFAAGRHAARSALECIGAKAVEIAVGSHREPIWPEGYVGSISHSGDVAIAVAARSCHWLSLGTDIECVGAANRDLVELILASDSERDITPTLLLSMKESIFKCLYYVYRRYIDFNEVSVSVDFGKRTFVGHPSPSATDTYCSVHGSFDCTAGYWMTVCHLSHPSPLVPTGA